MMTHQPVKAHYGNYHQVLLSFFTITLIILMSVRLTGILAFGGFHEFYEHIQEWPTFFSLSFRFDLKVVALATLIIYWLPLTILAPIASIKSFTNYARIALSLGIFSILLVSFIDLGYLGFFGRPIDTQIFGFLEDDTKAIISSIITDRRPLSVLISFTIIATVVIRKFNYISKKNTGTLSKKRFYTEHFLILILLVILGRGSFDTFPLRSTNADVGSSPFVNSMVLNSAFNIEKAIGERKELSISKKPDQILTETHSENIDELARLAGYANLDGIHTITSSTKSTLPHVIMVQMEGWSTEVILGQSEKNQVLGEFSKHIDSDHFFRNFFSNEYGTNPTIESLLLNSPITPLSQSATYTSFSTSNVLPFKKNGYRTLFISGGDATWRNHQIFWPKQGFDKYIGRAEIERKYNYYAKNNPWGTYDSLLFQAVLDETKQAEIDKVPLFAFVLTTNNHSPIRLPEEYVAPPLDPSVYGLPKNDSEAITALKGFHFQTDAFGKFISQIKGSEALSKDTIIAATGDHVLKGFTDRKSVSETYYRYSVPAYFFTPESYTQLKKVDRQIAGSHVDIFPTLFELALPKTAYYRFGTPLHQKNPASAYGWIENHHFIFANGIAQSGSEKLNIWRDKQQILLSNETTPLSSGQKNAIQQESYRKKLKEWMLLTDYEKSKTH